MLMSLDAFALRQFVKGGTSSSPIPWDPVDFCKRVNSIVEERNLPLEPGYADFCKHVFIDNFTPATLGYLEITEDNQGLLRSDYIARTPRELAVLSRWFPREHVDAPRARYLDVILYSRAQVELENAATGDLPATPDTEPWAIISIKPQHCAHELPMEPITAMRNALPLAEGGSGTPLQREAYTTSVAFWSKHARIN